MSAPHIEIRPYRDSDWPRLCAIHDAARKNELALAGLSDAFLPLEVAAQREGLFDYALRVAELDGQQVHIDTTWGDSGSQIDYDYFAMTPEKSWQAHAW